MKDYYEETVITVDGKEFVCLIGYGVEYLDDTDGYGWPIKPYQFEKIVTDDWRETEWAEFAYLIDAKGIIWITGGVDGKLFRPCFREGIHMVSIKDPDFNEDIGKAIAFYEQFMPKDNT